MPQDSILDVVNNIEPLYLDLQAFLRTWYLEGWSEETAISKALALAAHFAKAIGGYGPGHIKRAAREMTEEYEEFLRYHEGKLQAAAKLESEEATRVGKWEASMTPEDLEHAKKYEEISRKVGVDLLKELIPVPSERIRKAIEQGDSALNSIPLRKWDRAANQIPYLPGKGLSLAEKVSVLKHVAKWHYA